MTTPAELKVKFTADAERLRREIAEARQYLAEAQQYLDEQQTLLLKTQGALEALALLEQPEERR
jgi:chromosome condensin MukBEF ATPase and DNA-binding subunit MukB